VAYANNAITAALKALNLLDSNTIVTVELSDIVSFTVMCSKKNVKFFDDSLDGVLSAKDVWFLTIRSSRSKMTFKVSNTLIAYGALNKAPIEHDVSNPLFVDWPVVDTATNVIYASRSLVKMRQNGAFICL